MKHCEAGIDVSAKTLAVSSSREGRDAKEFANTAKGHEDLIRWLTSSGWTCRVVLEPSGIYSLDIALALDAAPRVEVMVANPRRVANFARATCKRGKTDAMDAEVLRQFAQTMPFQPWNRPTDHVLQLRQLTRHARALTRQKTRTRNKLHTARATRSTPRLIVTDLEAELKHVAARIRVTRGEAHRLVQSEPTLDKQLHLLLTVPGVGEATAVALISELSVLPADMKAKQWVAHAGLDPRPRESGTSLHGKTRISKHGNAYLRHTLFMPALQGGLRDRHIQAFKDRLVARGKTRLQAVVAVMRKLLHAIYGMLLHGQPWDGSKFTRMDAQMG